jgi:hypothetical protein
MNLNPFSRRQPTREPTEKRVSPQVIMGTPQLPTKDLAQYLTENATIPQHVKDRLWFADHSQAALTNLDRENRIRMERRFKIRDMVRRNFAPVVPFYYPGHEYARTSEDLDYHLVYLTALYKSETDGRKENLLTRLTGSSTTLETRQGTTVKPEPASGLKGFLGT